ncbi:putative anti-sigma factor [Lachnospiraceae bacterium TWA4]|nr:putative anti-sigma factor [Lachnospiraceae bacterium TWA4]
MKKNLENQFKSYKKEYESIHMSVSQVEKMKQSIHKAKLENRNEDKRMRKFVKGALAVAAAAAIVILPNTSANIAYAMGNIPVVGQFVEVITFRDYTYTDGKNVADIKVPELEVSTTGQTNLEVKKSVDKINTEIKEVTNNVIKEFKEGLSEEGNQNVGVDYEIIHSTDKYFTLKIDSYDQSGSGIHSNTYYTIDLKTGKRLNLKDLFVKDADYIAVISKNIKEQMKVQMDADKKCKLLVR